MCRRILYLVVTFILLTGLFNSCKIGYSFTGANISPAVKTFSVYYFPNRARLVNPTLSQSFTEAMREKLQRQTSLNELAEDGDLIFEGQITGYEVRPMSIQKEDMAALNRLTISVRVKYTNNIDPDQSIDRTFSAYEDFDSASTLTDVEDGLVPEIITKLTEDIFNATLANW
ncbi:MAG TPA: LptE family protein [Mariniphaga sp.]|nr:LptE family protein [Mariniphaga sp.]